MFQISLEAARVNARMTQQEAADFLKVSVNTIHSWEQRKSFPEVDQFLLLCKLYRCPMNHLSVLK